MKLSVVIPVYGCKDALPELYRRLTESLTEITDDYEIILVNDACPQDSWSVIEELSEKDSHIVGIELSRNFGQMKAILAGLDYSSGDWVVVMDCDLQDRPEEIRRLYAKALEGYDAVFARRAKRKDSFLKVFLANQFYKIYRFATDSNYDGALCNFSIVNRKVVDSYCEMREIHRAYIMYINWLGFRRTVIDVEHNERYSGKSSYSLKKRINMAVELLTSQSDKILRMMVKLGFLMTIISFFVILGLVIKYFTSHVTEGWTSLLASNFLIGGIVIMVVGTVGIYVGNIFMQVKNRPLYIVRQVKNKNEAENAGDKNIPQAGNTL